MTKKAQKETKPAAAAKAPKKATVAATAKAEKKAAKGAVEAVTEATEPAVDLDEIEEQEDAAAAGNGGGGNAAALAAATGTGEMSASFKNFRHHPDMENFYRFIYENDLRHEALAIIDQISVEKQSRKQAKAKGAH